MDNFEGLLGRIGENIKELRKLNHWTQTELAERAKRPQSSVARVESATYADASLSLLNDLCKSLGTSMADVLATSEGRPAKAFKKGRLTTKWERTRARVDELSEAERSWVADIVSAVLNGHGTRRR